MEVKDDEDDAKKKNDPNATTAKFNTSVLASETQTAREQFTAATGISTFADVRRLVGEAMQLATECVQAFCRDIGGEGIRPRTRCSRNILPTGKRRYEKSG